LVKIDYLYAANWSLWNDIKADEDPAPLRRRSPRRL